MLTGNSVKNVNRSLEAKDIKDTILSEREVGRNPHKTCCQCGIYLAKTANSWLEVL